MWGNNRAWVLANQETGSVSEKGGEDDIGFMPIKFYQDFYSKEELTTW